MLQSVICQNLPDNDSIVAILVNYFSELILVSLSTLAINWVDIDDLKYNLGGARL
jgi:hypothetical protein